MFKGSVAKFSKYGITFTDLAMANFKTELDATAINATWDSTVLPLRQQPALPQLAERPANDRRATPGQGHKAIEASAFDNRIAIRIAGDRFAANKLCLENISWNAELT
jgi:hypothetical protein